MDKTQPTTPAPLARDPGTSLSLLITVMVLTIVPLIALSQVVAYWRTDVVDDQMFGYYGWRIAHGATVYRDIWDNKPPGVYWINAVGMLVGADSYFGVIAMCALAMAVAHAAFFVAGAAVYHRGASALTTILLACYLLHAYYTGGTNRTETFLVACELAAVALYLRGFVRDRWWKWYLAGLCAGLAFLFKQVGLAAWGCMGVHLFILMLTRELRVMDGIKRGLLLVLGVATTLAAAAGYLASQGALHEALFATFGFNQYYFEANNSRFPYNLVNWYLLREHVRPIMLLPLLMATAAAIHAFLWWLRPQYPPPEIEAPLKEHPPAAPKYFLFFALWFAVAFYGALMSPHGFRHYIVPSIPPLLLMCGYLINVLRAETRLLRRLQQRAWVTAAFVMMGYFSWEAIWFQFTEVSKVLVFRLDQHERASWEVAAEAVDRWSTPDQKIQCLGYMPGVYLHSRRLNVSRYTTTEKMGQLAGLPIAAQISRELATTLQTQPPVLMVMAAEDYYGLNKPDLDGKWPEWFQLGHWLTTNYQLVDEIPKYGTIYIFKRKDTLQPGDPNLDSHLQRPAATPARAPATAPPSEPAPPVAAPPSATPSAPETPHAPETAPAEPAAAPRTP
jgi:hypothetical protein